jgi:S1-C subfamily serine protease
VIVNARDGLIVTNNHVIENAYEIWVTTTDGQRVQASLVNADSFSDLAVIKIAATGLVALLFGDSDRLEAGDYVMAIGNPYGTGQTVTHGIVSALRRPGFQHQGSHEFVQTDAAINPGNSGGALVNLRGELIGINTEMGPPRGNGGIDFAIPVNMVRQVIDRLIESGEVRRVQLENSILTHTAGQSPTMPVAVVDIVARADP